MNKQERSQSLFKLLVEEYLKAGLPVSSKTLAAHQGVNLSSATIRNIMSEFESQGLLHSKHTSGGRIPTQQGLRFFVDSLLKTKQPVSLPQEALMKLKEKFAQKSEALSPLEHVSHLLSGMTQLVSLVSLPKSHAQILRHIEFLPLDPKKVLVILVLNQEKIENRIITVKSSYTKAELIQISNYLNNLFAGKELVQIRAELLQHLKEAKENLNKMMQFSIEMAEKALHPNFSQKEFFMRGEHNLLELAEFSDLSRLSRLFETFSQKNKMLELIDQCLQTQGVHILIGDEGGIEAMGSYGMVSAPYTQNGQIVGVLGVIGPARMPYQRVLSIVEVTAKLLSKTLNCEKSSPINEG